MNWCRTVAAGSGLNEIDLAQAHQGNPHAVSIFLSKRSRNVLTFDAIEMSARGDSWLDDTVPFA